MSRLPAFGDILLEGASSLMSVWTVTVTVWARLTATTATIMLAVDVAGGMLTTCLRERGFFVWYCIALLLVSFRLSLDSEG